MIASTPRTLPIFAAVLESARSLFEKILFRQDFV